MNLDQEITHLLDIMPASGRMFTKIVNKPQQTLVIEAPTPLPWNQGIRPIYINFDLWRLLSRGQRDLLLLATVSNILAVRWLKPDIFQGITLVGLAGLTTEIVQSDPFGIVIAGGLTAIAVSQIWRNNRSLAKQLEADQKALSIAQRRGYTEVDAARHLLGAIEILPQLENRNSLNFTDLIRCQNLRVIGNLSPIGVPENIRK